jgi:hypothetical protein
MDEQVFIVTELVNVAKSTKSTYGWKQIIVIDN